MSEEVVEVDARGLMCPLPLLRLKKALLDSPERALLRVSATDPAARLDFGVFLERLGHQTLVIEDEGDGVLVFLIRKVDSGRVKGQS